MGVFFIWLDSVISIVSRLLIRFCGSWAGIKDFYVLRVFLGSVSVSSYLFSVSINEILDLCLLDSFFQGYLSFGVSSGLSLLSNFWGGGLLGLVVIVWILGICSSLGWVLFFFWVFSYVGLGLDVFLWIWFSMGLGYQVSQAFS